MQVSVSSELTANRLGDLPGRFPYRDSSQPWKGAFWERRDAVSRERWSRGLVRERPPEAAAAREVRNLEEVTLKPQPSDEILPDVVEGAPCSIGQLGVKVTTYPDGVRVVLYRSGPVQVSGAGGLARAAGSLGVEDSKQSKSVSADAERSAASVARSKRLVVHRARALGVAAMWTFTKRGKFKSSDEVWAAWRAFTKIMRRRYGGAFRYVAVPELHADGETWHLHVVVDRIYMVESLRILWQRALGGTGRERGDQTKGNVNVKGSRARGSSSRRFASYIAKYVSKGFERGGANRRVFAASVGISPVVVTRWRCPHDLGLIEFTDSVGEWLRDAHGIQRFFPRLFFRDGWECAIAECPLPAVA